MTLFPVTSVGSSTSVTSNGTASVTVWPPWCARVTSTTRPSTAVASSGTETWSPSSSTRPISRRPSRTVAALVTPSMTCPSTTRWIVFWVETRSTSRPSDAERDAESSAWPPRRSRPSTASPTVRAVVHTVSDRPSTSTAISWPWRTTTWDPELMGSPRPGATRSRSPTLILLSARTSPTVRPNALTSTVDPSTSTVRDLWSTVKALVAPTTRASTTAWAPNRAVRPSGAEREARACSARARSRRVGGGSSGGTEDSSWSCVSSDSSSGPTDPPGGPGGRPDRNRSVTRTGSRPWTSDRLLTPFSSGSPGLPPSVDRFRRLAQRLAEAVDLELELRCDPPDRVRQEVRRVRPPAVRVGREVGRIGLDEDLAERDGPQGLTQGVVGTERHRAREGQVPAATRAVPCHRGVPREAVEHRPLRGAVPLEHLDDLLVRVAVVDLQREAELLRERDVRAEGLDLDRAAARTRTEVVEPGLADRAHPVVAARDRRDRRDRVVEPDVMTRGRRRLEAVRRDLADTRVEDGLVRVDRDRSEQRDCGATRVHGRGRPQQTVRPRRSVEVAADLHDPGHPDGRSAVEVVVESTRAVRVVDREVEHRLEMRVVVDDRRPQRLRVRRPATLARARPAHDAAGSSIRGNSEAPFVTTDPAGSCPNRPASATCCAASGPSTGSAPRDSHSAAAALGVTGASSTASARSASAAVTRIVASLPPGTLAPAASISAGSFATFQGSCSVR